MATSKRSAARTRRNGMEQREPTQREPRYDGEGYRADGTHGDSGGYSGSPAHRTTSHGPGPVPGAGELDGIGGPGPGRAAGRVSPDATENPIRRTPPGTTPRGAQRQPGGEED